MPNRLFFLAALISILAVRWTNLPTKTAVAQTEDSVITVPQPTLSENDAPFPAGWLSIVGKSQYTIYLTGNIDATAVGTAASGQWQPQFPADGQYRVELYVGVSEFREYALLFPERLAGLDQLTQSAHITVTHADGESEAVVDFALRDSGWVDLGIYSFAAGSDGFVVLSNQTNEAAGTAVIPFSAARFTSVETAAAPPTATATEPATPTSPPPTATATATTAATATAVPNETSGPIDLLSFGSPDFASSEEGGLTEAEVPLLIDGEPIGRMTISYPTKLETGQADNIKANIFVEDEFADILTLALEDATTNEVVGDTVVQSQFYLSLEAASFAFDETFKTQKLTIFQGQPAGVAWNIAPKSGINGRQEFNIKVILRFSDGIPEVSGPPPTFSIDVRSSAPPPLPTATATPTSGGRIIDNLIDNTAVLIGGCLSFIIGLLGVGIAYLNYRKDKKGAAINAPASAALDTDRQIQLHGWLDDYFDEQELRTLSMEMGIDYDDLRFSGQTNKARELVGWSARNGRLDDLAAKIQAARPKLAPDNSSESG